MANNTEGSGSGAKRRRSSNEAPVPLSTRSHSKLDSTIESIFRKKVRERRDRKVSIESVGRDQGTREPCSSGDGTFGSSGSTRQNQGPRHWGYTGKIWRYHPRCRAEAAGRCHWKSLHWCWSPPECDSRARRGHWWHFCRVEISPSETQRNHLRQGGWFVEAATSFAIKISPDSAVARASKALQAEINRKESKQRESAQQSETFNPSEPSICKIIRLEQASPNARIAIDSQQSSKKVYFFTELW